MNKFIKGFSIGLTALAFMAGQAHAVSASDLIVKASSLTAGTANGFLGKGTYKNGARVFVSAKATYEQTCQNDTETVVVSQDAAISKEVDSYSNRTNKKGKTNGYLWNVSFSLAASGSILCQEGYVAVDNITKVSTEGKAYLSKDGGVTTLLDEHTGLPVEVSL
jgi:hypothetical protein